LKLQAVKKRRHVRVHERAYKQPPVQTETASIAAKKPNIGEKSNKLGRYIQLTGATTVAARALHSV
jgi:hypothetical protein